MKKVDSVLFVCGAAQVLIGIFCAIAAITGNPLELRPETYILSVICFGTSTMLNAKAN